MVPICLMIWPTHAHINLGFVKKGSTILTHSWFVLTSDQCIDHHYHNNHCKLHHVFQVTHLLTLGSMNKSEQLTNNQQTQVASTWAPAGHDPEHVRRLVRASGSQDCTGQIEDDSLQTGNTLIFVYLLFWSKLQVMILSIHLWKSAF